MNSKKKVVRDYFDQEVMTWEMLYTKNSNFLSHNMVERQKRVLEMLDQRLRGGAAVLDVGCGAGMTMLQLLQRGQAVYGVDISSEMIRKAKQSVLQAGYNGGSCNFSTGDVEALPFVNEYFDAVICMGVFSYLEDDIKAIREIYRVLKHKGIAIITLLNSRMLPGFLDIMDILKTIRVKITHKVNSANELNPLDNNYSFVKRRYVPWKFNELIKTFGFEVRDYVGTGFGPLTFNNKEIFSEPTNVKISKKVAKVAGIPEFPLLNLLGHQYIVKLEKC